MEGDAPYRECTECPNPVTGKRLTCSDACRTRRSKRQRENRASGRDVPRLVTGEAEVVAREELAKAIRPVVREALTEEVLRGIQDLVGSVPEAVSVAHDLLDSEDEEVRLKAATLIMRHSVGNRNVVPDVNDGRTGDLNVTFALPRPDRNIGAHPQVSEDGVIPPPVATRQCDACFKFKPEEEFETGSDRCTECFNGMRATAIATLGRDAIEHSG